jgi:inosine-uridine nucleoside N-ribohydrolase
MTLKNLIFCFILFYNFFSTAQKKEPKLNVIIDTDSANEIDDLFAITRAIEEPNFRLLGITAAQFHTSPYASGNTALESQEINKEFIDLIPNFKVPLIVGSSLPLENAKTPRISDASQFIINQARILPKEKKLYLIILGSCTNVASAILEAPEIKSKLIVFYVGFWHDTKKNIYDKKEFNTNNDIIATNFLLDLEGLDFRVMSATTSQNLVFDKTITFNNLGDNYLGVYLKQRWIDYERWWTKKDIEKKYWIMWDLAIIEALINPELTEIKLFKTPLENLDRNILIYTSINSKKMEDDFWKHYKTLINQTPYDPF